MKKIISTALFSCLVFLVAGQDIDTMLTQYNWKFYPVGTQAALFTLPATSVDEDVVDTVMFEFPVLFSTAFIARASIVSDTLADTISPVALVASLIIESAPTSIGPWKTVKTIAVNFSASTITSDFYVRDLFIRAKYLVTDGFGRLRTWITMKPSTIPE